MFEQVKKSRRTAGAALCALALLFVTTACQMSEEPSADVLREALESGLDVAGFKPDDTLRARYLPPIGSKSQVKHGEFVDEMDIEVAIFRLTDDDSAATGPALETYVSDAGDVITVDGDTYDLSWPVLDPNIAERVRVEIRMVGSGEEPVCNVYEGECYGYLDVRIVEKGGKGNGGGSSKGMITVPSGKTLDAAFKVLVPTNLEELATLSRQGGLNPESGSCPADELRLPSQGLQAVGAGLQAVGAGLQAVGAGLQAVGAAGGLFAARMESGSTDVEDLLHRSVDIQSLVQDVLLDYDPDLDVKSPYAEKTVILVLDDFGGDFKLPHTMLYGEIPLPSSGILPYTYSHGALVFHELRSLLTALFGHGHGHETTDSYYVDFAYGSIRLQAVDARDVATGHIDTEEAASALRSAMKSAWHHGYKRAVVNMSFSIVPCDVLTDFASTEPATFEDYVEALLGHNGVSGQTAEMLGHAVQSPVTELDDPLLDFIACPRVFDGRPCGAYFQSIVNVAASGNYGLDFPLFPAAAGGVISVGSQSRQGGQFEEVSGFSNAATIVAAGDVILLRTDGKGSGLAYIGTSFSAPIVSLFVALDQRTGSPTCDAGDPGDPGEDPPQLAKNELDDVPLLPGLRFDDADPSAVELFCTAS
ncbi:MAG TPA: S8/S53 family peptidase [Trueperaceae bacterium]|nr:S8/S53 family peptidase [Trueperaceae bacterium]